MQHPAAVQTLQCIRIYQNRQRKYRYPLEQPIDKYLV